MRVLVLRHHDEDLPGLVGESFAARGATVATHLYPEPGSGEGSLPDLGGYDHLVVLGSSSSVYEPAGWIAQELDWIRQVRIPVFGICFGAQLLSTAFGGAVERAPAYELGWVGVDPVDGDGDGDGGGDGGGDWPVVGPVIGRGPWFQFHGDRCVLPPTARVLATSAVGVQAFTIGTHLGVQFHPEVDAGQVRRWIEQGGGDDMVRAGFDPEALVAETAREELAARRRTDELVGAYLDYTEQVKA